MKERYEEPCFFCGRSQRLKVRTMTVNHKNYHECLDCANQREIEELNPDLLKPDFLKPKTNPTNS